MRWLKMYDIFYVSRTQGDIQEWQSIKSKYPTAQRLVNINSYQEIKSRSLTKMFWVIWDDVRLEDSFDLFNYQVTKWDDMYVHVFKNGEHYDGVCLFSKKNIISQREFDNRFFIDKKEIDIVVSYPRSFKVYTPLTFEEYQQIEDEMFWIVWPEVSVIDPVVFNLYFSHHNSYDRRENHVFKNLCNDTESYLSGIILCSKHKPLSKREFDRKYLIDKKEHDIVASKYRYPQYFPVSYTEYLEICNKETSSMFWCVWPNIEIINNSVFDLYFDPLDGKYDYDRNINHMFKNSCNGVESYLNGVVLFSTKNTITEREFNRRYLVDKKEHNIVVSKYSYPTYTINTYQEYTDILKKENQKMFWCVWPNIEIVNENIFDFYFDPLDGKYDYDRNINHMFKNSCNGVESYLNGVVLFSTNTIISEKEFNRKFLIDKKEHNLVVSKYRYPRYSINNYNEYLEICNKETSSMFWCVWSNIEIINPDIFDFYFDPLDGKYDYDRNINHMFKNSCNGVESYLNGVVLFSTKSLITEREFNRKYLVDKKEIDVVASKYCYPRYSINSYDEYLEICNKETSALFWCVWPEINIVDDLVFDFYFDPLDGKYDQDRTMNHTFMHRFNNVDIRINGLMLLSKDCIISRKEFNHRFLINKKEHDRVASEHRVYDVVFISYNESNADDNYEKLLKHCPRAKRVHGVKGIHAAHFKAAEMCNTDMIWIVDGDAIIEDDFSFDLVMSSYDLDCVHVWKSRNPINNLEYGNGGVKLLPRQLTLKMDFNTPDMTTSISNKFKAMDVISNTNAFNTDEFSTWRSAFRECCKLSSGIIDRQYEEETRSRLEAWCTIGADKLYGKNAIQGALMGRAYGEANKNNADALCKINDFIWLQEKYNEI